jgi:hypothetical protein
MPKVVTFTVYNFDELSPDAQQHATVALSKLVRMRTIPPHDNDDIARTVYSALAEKLGTPLDMEQKPYPAVPFVIICDWRLTGGGTYLSLGGTLDRQNAPALTWGDNDIEGILLDGGGLSTCVGVLAPDVSDAGIGGMAKRVRGLQDEVFAAVAYALKVAEQLAHYLNSDDRWCAQARAEESGTFLYLADGSIYSGPKPDDEPEEINGFRANDLVEWTTAAGDMNGPWEIRKLYQPDSHHDEPWAGLRRPDDHSHGTAGPLRLLRKTNTNRS